MILSEKYKIIFIHNQKTAGTSIEKYLNENIGDSETILPVHAYTSDGIEKLGREKWDDYYSFGFVRNPWARLVSWYVMITENSNPRPKNPMWNYVRNKTFDEFIKNCTDEIVVERMGILYRKSLVRNQLDYFTDEKGNIAVSFIGKFENIEEDFDKIKLKNNLPNVALPKVNVNRAFSYRDYYSNDTKIIIENRFQKDIEYFGYTF